MLAQSTWGKYPADFRQRSIRSIGVKSIQGILSAKSDTSLIEA